MDRNLLKGFTDAINKQARLYDEIKRLIENKAMAIRAGEAKKIEAAVQKEENALKNIRGIEQEVNGIFEGLAKAAGFLESQKAGISDVLLKFDKESAAEIEKALVGLSKAVSGAAGMNAQNTYLLKNRVEFAGFSEAARQKLGQPGHTVYGMDGDKKPKSAGSGGIDRTI